MNKAVAINGSPRMEKGNTAMVLTPFIQGMRDAGGEVELFYASRLQVKPCSCGVMYCWNEAPGECCFKDDMQQVYPKLREADTMVIATPVYIPLPGEMQNVINRLCPLLDPVLEFREGRTRARFREGVGIRRLALVSTSGWWEIENFGTVVRVVKEFAEAASVEFAGAVLRPHALLMKEEGELTRDGEFVLDAARKAGCELIQEGKMTRETLDRISQPLVSREELWRKYSRAL
ncbi:MAG: flavodoxin family protein [Anaerolineales bacterium]